MQKLFPQKYAKQAQVSEALNREVQFLLTQVENALIQASDPSKRDLEQLMSYIIHRYYNQAIWRIQKSNLSIPTEPLEFALSQYLTHGRIIKATRHYSKGRRKSYRAIFENGLQAMLKPSLRRHVSNAETSHYGLSQLFRVFHVPITVIRTEGSWRRYTCQFYVEGTSLDQVRETYRKQDKHLLNYLQMYEHPLSVMMIHAYFNADSDGDISNYLVWEKGELAFVDGDITFGSREYNDYFDTHQEYYKKLSLATQMMLLEDAKAITYDQLSQNMAGTENIYIDWTWKRIQNYILFVEKTP